MWLDDDSKKEIKVGDLLPLKSCSIIDTYYMVSYQGSNYFVNSQGKVVAVLAGNEKTVGSSQPQEQAPPDFHEIPEGDRPPPQHWEVKLFGLTGTKEYDRAVQITASFLEAVRRNIQREYRSVSGKLDKILLPTPALIAKFLDRRSGGLPGLKAHVIRELFANTTIEERGMEILGFLTQVISMTESGNILYVGRLDQDEQKRILVNFLNFVGQLGDTKEKKRIIALAYRYFFDPELDMAMEKGNTGFYINHSFAKAMKAHRDFLRKVYNRTDVDSQYEQVMRLSREFIITHFLSYMKALLILRIVSLSKKEQRGSTEDEREFTLREIISF